MQQASLAATNRGMHHTRDANMIQVASKGRGQLFMGWHQLQRFTTTEDQIRDEDDGQSSADNDSNAGQEEVATKNPHLFLYDPNDPYDEQFFPNYNDKMLDDIDINNDNRNGTPIPLYGKLLVSESSNDNPSLMYVSHRNWQFCT